MEGSFLATLTLKKVPEQLVARLKEEAKENRRSLNQEALSRLERSVADRKPRVRDTLAALRRLHRRLAYLPPLTDGFLDRAKRAGRP